QRAGKNPTRQGFIDGLHNLGAYKPADLTCQPIDLSLKNFGKTPTTGCQYYLTFKHGKFVVMNNGKPYFGRLVGDPALIAANNTGTAADVTTPPTPGHDPRYSSTRRRDTLRCSTPRARGAAQTARARGP